jgi:hypothetical protein
MNRREMLKSVGVGATALALPTVAIAEAKPKATSSLPFEFSSFIFREGDCKLEAFCTKDNMRIICRSYRINPQTFWHPIDEYIRLLWWDGKTLEHLDYFYNLKDKTIGLWHVKSLTYLLDYKIAINVASPEEANVIYSDFLKEMEEKRLGKSTKLEYHVSCSFQGFLENQ